MPRDADDKLIAEPKLLSLERFPALFSRPVAPKYNLGMTQNTHYHRVDDPRASTESSTGTSNDAGTSNDTGIILLDPLGSDDGSTPPSRWHKVSCHPTPFLRLIAVCALIPSFVLLVLTRRPRSVLAMIFICIAIVRNVLVIFLYLFSPKIRVQFSIEFRSHASRAARPSTSYPKWLQQGPLQFLLDLILLSLLLIATIIATSGAFRSWHTRLGYDVLAETGCILAYVGFVFYLVSIVDMGNPSDIILSSNFSFNSSNDMDDDQQEQPQVYRDLEAAASLPAQVGETHADAPVIV